MTIFPTYATLPVHHLAACFNNTSATYKFYWFLAIVECVEEGEKQIDKEKLFAKMMANAWYTVNYFHVSFGPQDLIQSTIRKLKEIENIPIDLDKQGIVNRLLQSTNPETIKLLRHFNGNVPHWFLSPWYPRQKRADIYRLSQLEENAPIYQLYDATIVVSEEWYAYLQKHARLIKDYIFWNLCLFLQSRNPNVPDIANKLIKPAVRNSLTKQRKFWDFVIAENGPIHCIYTDSLLDIGDYHVEHFVPYSFVSHDLIWNLIPAEKTFNIVKSNKLPSIEKYFASFYDLQKLAVETFIHHNPKERLLEDYLHIGADINTQLSKKNLYNAIQPLITIASNNGFEFL